MDATGTATDPLGADDTDILTVSAGGATGLRTIRRSAWGSRVNWGSAVDSTTQGPTLVTDGTSFHPAGPITLATTFTMMRDCNIVGARIYKSPLAAGTVPVKLWGPTGTELATVDVSWSSDDGGWREILFSSPVAVTDGTEYSLGYYSADDNYAFSPFVINSQDTILYPFKLKTFFSTGAGVNSNGSGFHVGSGIAWPSTASGNRSGDSFYIDPIAEWDEDLPAATDGFLETLFETAGPVANDFTVAVFFADPENLAGYVALGVNTLVAGSASDAYIAAVLDAGIEWYPSLSDDAGLDLDPVYAVYENPGLESLVRGYLLNDEPDLNAPYVSPTSHVSRAAQVRALDSSRPIYLNLSYLPVKNQGFIWQPSGATPTQANQVWSDYAAIPDILSCDFYCIAATDDFAPSSAELADEVEGRYGIWAYPLQIQRMREISSDTKFIWGVVNTTSAVPSRPTPTEVKQAVWAQLIAGAKGIVFFDHRFATANVTQDFAAMLNDSPMSTAVSALTTQIQSLSGALLKEDADLVSSVESSNTTEGPIGGTYGVPIHFTSRQDGGLNYVFAQAIRPGTTTGTFTVPSAASKTVTVIGESRTVSPDGSGVFTDDFDADYEYHLYSWTP